VEAQQKADAMDGGVTIGTGIFGENFAREELTIRCTADNVGEGAATINPEIPSLSFTHHFQSKKCRDQIQSFVTLSDETGAGNGLIS
jgi:hypothetical protein